MQKMAAYRLERLDDMGWPEARSAEADSIKRTIQAWLASKGGTPDATRGEYSAEDGSHATFAIEQASSDGQAWWMTRLAEVTPDGRRVTATISITTTARSVVVYATLKAGSSATQINPINVDLRCPKVVRTLLSASGNWYHGASPIHPRREKRGFEEGEKIALEIGLAERTIPVVVVTKDIQGRFALPALADKLSYDLAGLANVVVLDADATWALTDELGSDFACYGGAVRLYWPRLTAGADPFRHPRWTATRLQSFGDDHREVRERFRRQLRTRLMRASALSVVRPPEIEHIRDAASRRAFTQMKERAKSLEDYETLADSYAADNEELRKRNQELRARMDELAAEVLQLEDERAALLMRVQNAELQLRFRSAEEPEITPDTESDPEPELAPPVSGETRFYKKHYSTPKHDIMLRVSDCGCDNWEGAHAADKARKGILKLEGRSDWKTLQHCASCTGGGMWRVRW